MAGFIKICGLRDAAAVDAALHCGADALGFVFAPSVRRVTPAQAAALAAPARGRVPCIAVMLHPSQAQCDAVLQGFAPDVLQTDIDDFAALQLPAQLQRLPVLRDATRAGAVSGRILFEGPHSGTGQVADWSAAAQLAAHHELVLAGGLSPDNIAAAIAAVLPFGVDVSSGVEAAPGRKDPSRIANFIARARAAFAPRAEEKRA
jgi:phosphoribosylanthranilate isomerase